MKVRSTANKTGFLIRNSFRILQRNEPLILASSTSFFTAFSVIPLLLILANVLRLIFRTQEVGNQILGKTEGIFGKETGRYLQEAIVTLSEKGENWIAAVLGFLFLLFIITNLLRVVKMSINRIWQIKRKHVSRLKYTFLERAIAIGIILLTALLTGASILADAMVALIKEYLSNHIPTMDYHLIRITNILFSLVIMATWFMMIFKFLPDGKVRWRVAAAGGLVTGTMFNCGKWILGKLLIYSSLQDVFGASTSLALILLFIFYSSLMLYFGAAFTFSFGSMIGKPIVPGKYSEHFRVVSEDATSNQ